MNALDVAGEVNMAIDQLTLSRSCPLGHGDAVQRLRDLFDGLMLDAEGKMKYEKPGVERRIAVRELRTREV